MVCEQFFGTWFTASGAQTLPVNFPAGRLRNSHFGSKDFLLQFKLKFWSLGISSNDRRSDAARPGVTTKPLGELSRNARHRLEADDLIFKYRVEAAGFVFIIPSRTLEKMVADLDE